MGTARLRLSVCRHRSRAVGVLGISTRTRQDRRVSMWGPMLGRAYRRHTIGRMEAKAVYRRVIRRLKPEHPGRPCGQRRRSVLGKCRERGRVLIERGGRGSSVPACDVWGSALLTKRGHRCRGRRTIAGMAG